MLVCLLFCECLHMCTVKLTAVGYDHPQSKETKKKSRAWKGKKSEKEASVVLWLFCLQASDPNPSCQMMGNTSVILTLICKSPLSLIHFKFSLTLDIATSAISGFIDNARLQSVMVILKHRVPKLLFSDLLCCQRVWHFVALNQKWLSNGGNDTTNANGMWREWCTVSDRYGYDLPSIKDRDALKEHMWIMGRTCRGGGRGGGNHRRHW